MRIENALKFLGSSISIDRPDAIMRMIMPRYPIAFSSEVNTGSRKENASKKV